MKNLFTLIVILMMHSVSSQTMNITESQQESINNIFTAEKIIEISKGLSNEKKQDSTIIARDSQIQELRNKISLLKEEYTRTLLEIAKENKIAEESSQTIEDISDRQIKKIKFKWRGLHLYGGVEVIKFNLQQIQPNIELMYELEKVEFGFRGEAVRTEIQTYFNYSLKLRYKFF